MEKSIRWVAPKDGLFRFEVISEDFAVSLYLYEGAMCGGKAYQCNAAVKGRPAQVTRWLRAGQAVTAIVETSAAGGEFTFDVIDLEPEACGDIPELGDATNVSLSTANGQFELSASCEWAGNDYVGHWPEHKYKFTVGKMDPWETCQVMVEWEGLDAHAYVLRGSDCALEEVACARGTDAGGMVFEFTSKDEGEYTLVIENSDPFAGSGTYSVINDCPPL